MFLCFIWQIFEVFVHRCTMYHHAKIIKRFTFKRLIVSMSSNFHFDFSFLWILLMHGNESRQQHKVKCQSQSPTLIGNDLLIHLSILSFSSFFQCSQLHYWYHLAVCFIWSHIQWSCLFLWECIVAWFGWSRIQESQTCFRVIWEVINSSRGRY